MKRRPRSDVFLKSPLAYATLQRVAFERDDVLTIAERVNARLARGEWDTRALETDDVDTAAEVAVFALELAGKRRQARRGGRFGRLVVHFALAACLALSAIATACDKPDATAEETQTAIDMLPSLSGSQASITAQPRASPAEFTDMLLLDAGSDSSPWAVMQTPGSDSPILVDRVGSGLDTVGMTYRLAAQPVTVGTRDGTSQFLDPLQPATSTGTGVQPVSNAGDQLEQRWAQDERYLAATRAIAGQPTMLDAAYNAAAAAAAGGAHTYLNGVVLRAEPDQPALSVIDKALLESGTPTRAEDVVYVAIRPSEQSQYNPGQVINLRDVAVSQQKTDVNGQQSTVNVLNAALDGSRVEPVGSVDLQSLLQPRLQRVDQDLGSQAQAASSATPAPAPTGTPGAGTQPIIVQQQRGPSFVDDFLIWMWLSNSGFYRGPSVIINNPPASSSRSTDQVYYSPPPTPGGSTPSTVASSQSASRSTALEAARSSVSGQSSGTGGGVAATNKSAADSSARVSAATAKSAAVAGAVAASSAGRSISSVPSSSSSSSTASRSAGSTSAGTRGSAGVSSSSSGSKGIGGGSVSSGGSKGIGGSGGFGGGGSSSSSSS